MFGVQPSNTTAGATISPAVTVKVEDSLGNVVTTDTSNVTVAIGTNPGGGTLGGTTTVAAVSGTATFSTLSINKAGTGYTLTAADGTLTSATSRAFNITPAVSLPLSNQSVLEFRPNGTAVGTLSTTESGSGHTFTYTLVSGTGSTNNASFSISGNQLVTADAFASALQSSYSVLVQSTDETNQTVQQAFTITVTPDPNLSLTGKP